MDKHSSRWYFSQLELWRFAVGPCAGHTSLMAAPVTPSTVGGACRKLLTWGLRSEVGKHKALEGASKTLPVILSCTDLVTIPRHSGSKCCWKPSYWVCHEKQSSTPFCTHQPLRCERSPGLLVREEWAGKHLCEFIFYSITLLTYAALAEHLSFAFLC